jgi:molybdopterin adenylyltransferase
MNQELLIGLVSISDRASSGVYVDKGIPALRDWFGAGPEFALAHRARA